ncbi:hypothetical protein PanWU01x14_016880 [Parasponia andersonii]|uniref:Uncharacterized protein n=1 Tax=Parasponia andersonii TaxID=3476 RepID=A0A2P5DZS3_PARAD|nr:hypothetical protein PanWU01x14_016880 [Parasponia andersonii]
MMRCPLESVAVLDKKRCGTNSKSNLSNSSSAVVLCSATSRRTEHYGALCTGSQHSSLCHVALWPINSNCFPFKRHSASMRCLGALAAIAELAIGSLVHLWTSSELHQLTKPENNIINPGNL